MGKKNLDSILIKDENILPEKSDISPMKAPKKERDSEVLGLKITPTEMATLMDKKEKEAGAMAPLGTYVKHYLRTKTELFSKPKSDE